jgi:hypothetical protein
MRSNSGPAKRSSQGAATPRRRMRPRTTPARWPASASAPCAAQGYPPPEARTSPCAAPRGSSESSQGLARHAAPYRPGARCGPPVRRRHHAVHVSAEVAVLRRYLRRHCDVTGGALPIKTERHALLAPSPPLHRARHCWPPVNSAPRPSPVRPTFLAYSL